MYTKIKDLREDHDLKQVELAKKINMNTTTYQRYERGEREIPLNIAIIIADYYNVSIDYIAGRTKNKGGIGINNEGKITDEEHELIQEFRKLSKEGKARLRERAMMIAEIEAEQSAMTRGRKSS